MNTNAIGEKVIQGNGQVNEQPANAPDEAGLVHQSTLDQPTVDTMSVKRQQPTNAEKILAAITKATTSHEAVGALRGLTQKVDISLGSTQGRNTATNHWILVRPGKNGTELIYRRDNMKYVTEHLHNPFMDGWRHASQSERVIVDRSWGMPLLSVSQGSIELAEPKRLARLFATAMKLDFSDKTVRAGTRDRLHSAGYQCNRL